MHELTLEEIQQNSYNVLLKFKSICDELGLKYFLAYGTLIGAIRHKGFIPWDDDIDVWMPRHDYEKFINYCKDNVDVLMPFTLKHFRTCKEYIYPIARLVDTRYTIDYSSAKEYGLGLFIDIYPLDGINPDDKKLITKSKRLIRKISILGTKHYSRSSNPLKNIIKFPYYLLIKRQSINKVLAKADKHAKKYAYEESDNIGCIVWETADCLDKKDFSDYKEVIFNGELFKVPAGYDNILKSIYGDYMLLPPESERIAHHYYKAYKKDE